MPFILKLEMYFLTKFVNFNVKVVGVVVACHFLCTFLRFTFYVKFIVHWMSAIANENDMCVHCFCARY